MSQCTAALGLFVQCMPLLSSATVHSSMGRHSRGSAGGRTSTSSLRPAVGPHARDRPSESGEVYSYSSSHPTSPEESDF